MKFNKILFSEIGEIFTIVEYNIKHDIQLNNLYGNNITQTKYYNTIVKLELCPNTPELCKMLNKTNVNHITFVLFSEDTINCLILDKSFILESNINKNLLIVEIESLRLSYSNVQIFDKLKYISRRIKIKSILDI